MKSVRVIEAPVSGERSVVVGLDPRHSFGVRDDVAENFVALVVEERGVGVETREVLSGVNIPVAARHSLRHVRRQREQVGVIARREVRVVERARFDSLELIRLRLQLGREVFCDPVFFNPGVANSPRVGGRTEFRSVDPWPA